MSGDHPKLILDGIKTQTRRVIKPQPDLLYGIYGDIIQLYHNRRAEDDRVDIKTDTNFTKRQLYGWERWQDILTDKIQGFWEEGFRGVVSVSRLQDRGEGIFSCLLMPRQQTSDDVNSSASMYGFSRYASDKVNAGEAFGWQPAKQQAQQSQVGDSIRKLARQKIPQQYESELQQPELKNNQRGTGTYPLGSEDGHRQQKTDSQSLGHIPIFHIRDIPWFIGQRLWVRETWATEKRLDKFSGSELGNAGDVALWYKANEVPSVSLERGRWRSSRFMPRWASRILLEITDIRVEQLMKIDIRDIHAEGIRLPEDKVGYYGKLYVDAFHKLWDSLNAKRGYGWEVNPFVWVLSFRLVSR